MTGKHSETTFFIYMKNKLLKMDLKSNINKIHSDLLMLENIGETVTINESSSKDFGNHFVITAEYNGMTAKVIIEKSEIEAPAFRWRYLSNPDDETAGLVERASTLEGFVADLIEVFNKKRFDSDYLSQINN